MSDLRVFKRIEKKYLLTKEQYEGLMERISTYLRPDEYPEGLICNIYYDTPEFRLIRESLDKPFYKEKLRLRCYNEITEKDSAYLEIKKKYDGIVYKRREKMNVMTAEEFIKNPPLDATTQIARELSWFVRHYGTLFPAFYIAYDRLAFVEKETRVRITFDYNIRYRRENVTLIHGSRGTPLFTEGEVLMEIKAPMAIPLGIVKAMSELKIYPTSFSKYGTAYKKELLGGKI